MFDHGALGARREVGALEDRSGLRADLLHAHVVHLRRRCLRFGLRDDPFGSECTFTLREHRETFGVTMIPEEELEVFGRVLDVDEVVHEIPGGTWLDRRNVSPRFPKFLSPVGAQSFQCT